MYEHFLSDEHSAWHGTASDILDSISINQIEPCPKVRTLVSLLSFQSLNRWTLKRLEQSERKPQHRPFQSSQTVTSSRAPSLSEAARSAQVTWVMTLIHDYDLCFEMHR